MSYEQRKRYNRKLKRLRLLQELKQKIETQTVGDSGPGAHILAAIDKEIEEIAHRINLAKNGKVS